jgi:hypothetical protein
VSETPQLRTMVPLINESSEKSLKGTDVHVYNYKGDPCAQPMMN